MSSFLETGARPRARRRRVPRTQAQAPAPARAVTRQAPQSPPLFPVQTPWLRSQALNSVRHAAALRPFRRGEFGVGAASPTEGHLQAANALISRLRAELLRLNGPVRAASVAAQRRPSPQRLGRLLDLKERAHAWVRATEQIWDFYFELFGQRQGEYGDWLLSCDRIAQDCYQAAFRGVGAHKSIPAPPPFAYMRTGFSPATFRRGIPLSKLGRMPNPFPLVELPYHRLVNPWTLGAVLHEVSHNLQNDLDLDKLIPREIDARLRAEGLPPFVAHTWQRWNRETFADLSGLLLGGPAVIASLMDVVGRSRAATLHFGRGPHPTPYLRVLISVELLRRMGFPEQAERFRRAWTALYPNPGAGTIPRAVLETFPRANRIVVDTICFTRYPELGGRSLAESYRFEPKDELMIEEAARRLAAGNDPGVIPARFLISAARIALDRRLARPGTLARNFYAELSRR
ncbi:MAG: hypothetical protein QOI27_2508 [Gaiellaceae bacterium]|nr:hypothetical protein [Gaiellaceae bacterium]